MTAPLGAVISAFTALLTLATENSWRVMSSGLTCSWCGKSVSETSLVGIGGFDLSQSLCTRCGLLAFHSLELARQIAIEMPKGGVQLYIGVERTGQSTALISVRRWSPLEPLESADSAEWSLPTSQ